MNEKMVGKIKWFKIEKGYGYIKGFDEDDYYFEMSNLLFDVSLIVDNLVVRFISKSSNEMLYADEIEVQEFNNILNKNTRI